MASALAGLLAFAPEVAAQKVTDFTGISPYLGCDGHPNNRTGWEFVVAPNFAMDGFDPIQPDASRRMHGQYGVEACSYLIDGPHREGNARRRVQLIQARALHQLEIGDTAAALADVALARSQAAEAGLDQDPFYAITLGLNPTRIEALVAAAEGDMAKAHNLLLTSVADHPYSLLTQTMVPELGLYGTELAPEAEVWLAAEARLRPTRLIDWAERLQNAGRHAEAAEKLERLIRLATDFYSGDAGSIIYARAAVAQALAGNWARADELAALARASLEREGDAAEAANLRQVANDHLLLLEIMRAAASGDMPAARTMLLGKEEWHAQLNTPLLALIDQLRADAPPEALEGLLSRPAAAIRAATQYRERDRLTDEDGLFATLIPYPDVDTYRDRTRDTWRLDDARMSQPLRDRPDLLQAFLFDDGTAGVDAVVLHAALQARARGFDGFEIFVTRETIGPREQGYISARIRFVNQAEGALDVLFVPADEVIAELSQRIVPPRSQRRRRG